MNKNINILIVDNSAWAQQCCSWLSDRGYNCLILSDTAYESRWRHQDFDLTLMDESVWQANRATLDALAEANKSIAVVSSNYTIENFNRAMTSGAGGYIDKGLDRDAFIRELEKLLRSAGKLRRGCRVLVVDNDRQVLESLSNHLKGLGYEAYTADSEDKVMCCIQLCRPHVVVVDIRLRDDEDTLDQSGFNLSQEINEQYGHAVKVVGLSSFFDRKTAVMATKTTSGFVMKDPHYLGELVQIINQSFQDHKINRHLDVDFEKNLSLKGLVGMMKAYRACDEKQRRWIQTELEELIRKLFPQTIKVKGYYLSPGRGGSGVVLMRPVVQGAKGQYFVIKFGPRENIAIELENYNNFVKPFIIRRATYLVDIGDKPMETLNLGGLKFSFAGISKDNPRDFNTFFRDPKTTENQVCLSLRYLFNDACAIWYNNKQPWPPTTSDALATAYEKQLSLDRPDQQEELYEIITELLAGSGQKSISFIPHDHQQIQVELAEEILVLPEPREFIKRHRTDFPTPRFMCRTHGDLNGRNIFVDDDAKVWLIDFFKTGWGPILRDLGELETVIKFELLETLDVAVLLSLEKALLWPSYFNESIKFDSQDKNLAKAVAAIRQIRSIAQEKFEGPDMREYYVGLLFYAIKMLTWEGISSIERQRLATRQRHALLSAAMLCYRVKHWENWSGWPVTRKGTPNNDI